MVNDPLLTPYSLAGLQLRNRIVSTAHSSRYTSGGIPTERYRLYQEQKARGGIGLVTLGGSAVVGRDSAPAFGNITMYKDEVVAPLARITESCHDHGSGVMIQLTHMGRRTDDHTSDWLPTVSSASMREPAHRSYPKAAEPWDLDRIVSDFTSAAQRARAAGLDGIELEHYGHLLDAFASPWHLSKLSPEDRSLAAELPKRVIRAVKEVTGEDMVLGVRMAVDEARPDINAEALGLATRVIVSASVRNALDLRGAARGRADPSPARFFAPPDARSTPDRRQSAGRRNGGTGAAHGRASGHRRGGRRDDEPRRGSRIGIYP